MFSWSDGCWTDWRNIGFGAALPDEYTRGIPQGANNINCFPFAGEILASGEQGSPPVALDPITLQTRGVVSWSPQLSRGISDRAGYGDAAFTAHPKWDNASGTLYGWAYSNHQPTRPCTWCDGPAWSHPANSGMRRTPRKYTTCG